MYIYEGKKWFLDYSYNVYQANMTIEELSNSLK